VSDWNEFPKRVCEYLQDVQYSDWLFRVGTTAEGVFLQVAFAADGADQYGRKWLLSRHMTKSEVVQTAFKAVLTALEHEAREHFRYRGKAIFGPHFDVDVLHGIAGKLENLDLRPEQEKKP
jgi:hypothetical protein